MKKTLLFIFLSIIFNSFVFGQVPNLTPKFNEKKSVWGYVDSHTGNWVVKPKFTEAGEFLESKDGVYRALVSIGEKKGYLDASGKIQKPGIVFSKIEPMMKGDNLFVTVNGKIGIIKPNGEYLIKPDITSCENLGDEGYLVQIKGKTGFINNTGEWVVPAEYTDINTSEENFFIVKKGKKAALYSRNGQLIIEPKKYSRIESFNNYWIVYNNDKKGLYDTKKNKLLLQPKYADIKNPVVVEYMTIIPVMKKNHKWGAVNLDGKEVIKCKNMSVTPLPGRKAVLVYRNNMGYRLWFPKYDAFVEMGRCETINEGPFKIFSGTVNKPNLKYEDALALSLAEYVTYPDSYERRLDAYNSLRSESFMVISNSKGEEIGTGDSYLEPFGNYWLLKFDDGHTWDVYDSSGDLVKKTRLKANQFFMSDKKEWIADETPTGRVLFNDLREYDFINCGNDLQFYYDPDKEGWIPMIEDVPDETYCFSEVMKMLDNSASVSLNGKWGLFNDKIEAPCVFPFPVFSKLDENNFVLKDNNMVALYDVSGKEILPFNNNSITKTNNSNLVNVKSENKSGVYNISTKKWESPLMSEDEKRNLKIKNQKAHENALAKKYGQKMLNNAQNKQLIVGMPEELMDEYNLWEGMDYYETKGNIEYYKQNMYNDTGRITYFGYRMVGFNKKSRKVVSIGQFVKERYMDWNKWR